MTDTIAPAAGPTVKEQGGALLAHAGLIREPDLERLAGRVLGQRLLHQPGEVF